MMSLHTEQFPSTMAPLRVLAIDKVAVLRSYRERYTRLVERANIDLTLLVPREWVENFTPTPYQPSDEPEPYRTVFGVTFRKGYAQHGFYVSGLARAFIESRPDVVLMMEEVFSVFAVQVSVMQRIFAPNARLVFYSNNITSYRTYIYRLSPLYRVIGLTLMPMFDMGLCVNAKAVEALRSERFGGRIRELFYGINERLFQPADRRRARAALDLPDDADIFLYAGRLVELKGVQDLIAAFAGLVRERPGRRMKLVIVGVGEYEGELRSLASQCGMTEAVEFRKLVPIEQMPTYMSAATAFVLPTRNELDEQFGRVNAEAMLMRTPIIGSTSGGIPGVLGEAGYIFRGGDIADLKRMMAQVLDDPAEADRKRERGRERALQLFSMQRFVDGLIDALEELAERPLRREPVH